MFVRTVLGDIDPARLGVCYSHEHLIIDACLMTRQSADFQIDSVDLAVRELVEVVRHGAGALVDAMPIDCGRNAAKLAEISRRTDGLHVVTSTGLHHQKYYAPDHWRFRLGAEKMAEIFVREIVDGIEGGHRAGVIKVAGGLDRLDDHQKIVFEAAAIAHARTGAPVLTHCEQGTAAPEQVETLRRHGVEPRHVILSHVDKVTDAGYHKAVAAMGAYLEYDQHFRWKEGQGNPTLDLVLALVAEGLGDRIVTGMDAARKGYWKVYGGKPGMDYLLTTFKADLAAAGLRGEDLRRILVSNPAAAFAFKVA